MGTVPIKLGRCRSLTLDCAATMLSAFISSFDLHLNVGKIHHSIKPKNLVADATEVALYHSFCF